MSHVKVTAGGICIIRCFSDESQTSEMSLVCSCRNIQPKGATRGRAIPSISKSREAEIRKILRANLQQTRQRVGRASVEGSWIIYWCAPVFWNVMNVSSRFLRVTGTFHHRKPLFNCMRTRLLWILSSDAGSDVSLSSASLLQPTRPDGRPLRGQPEWGSLQEAEGGDGEEGEFQHWCCCFFIVSVSKLFIIRTIFCFLPRWVTTSRSLPTARKPRLWGKSVLSQVGNTWSFYSEVTFLKCVLY